MRDQGWCEPCRKIIEAYPEQRLTAQRICQDLRDDHGVRGGIGGVRDGIGCL